MKKRKATINGKAEYLVLIKQWIHQGFTYLDQTEMFYRVIWEIIPFSMAAFLLATFTELRIAYILIISFLISHTLNWIFNYNFWTCITFTFPSKTNPGRQQTIKYLAKMQNRMMKYDSIGGCMLYGSIARGKWHEKSDLDMRVLRKSGFINGFKSYLIICLERLIAFLEGQPLDLYLADSENFLNKMREDEFPIFLKNNDDRLHLKYNTRKSVDFKTVNDLNNILQK